MVVCMREAGAVKPFLLRDPNSKPFGYVPPEGYDDTPKIPAAPVPPALTRRKRGRRPGGRGRCHTGGRRRGTQVDAVTSTK